VDTLDLLIGAIGLTFAACLAAWLREPAEQPRIVVCLVPEDDGGAVEVRVADALRVLQAVGPHVGAVAVAARDTRSAMLVALLRHHSSLTVTDEPAGLPGLVLVASLGRGFRAAALLARVRAVLSTAAAGMPTKE